MFFSKFFALSSLAVCSCILAQVKLNTVMEINDALLDSNKTISTEIQLDAHNKAHVYTSNDVRIETELLAEEDENTTASYAIYFKNKAGNFEKFANPVLVATYGQEARLAIGSTNGGILNLALKASKL